jgi:anaerobic selenocysteine-containing dehydrogenase
VTPPARTITAVCRNCHGGCGTIVRVEDGRVTEVKGDPENPINRGKLCSKAGAASIEQLYHPGRLDFPLLREKKGAPLRRVSWDDALSFVSQKMNQLKAKHGAESVAFARGVGMNNQHIIGRVANLFGTPNLASISYVCYATRVAVCSVTATGKYGNKTWDTVAVPDFYSGPRCIVEWGSQKRTSNDHGLIGFGPMTEALENKPAHILVDPRKPSSAGPVDLWLPLRPGSDAAMALGWMNLIIEEELYDKEFVARHCHGFEALRERAKNYPLAKVADLTWCDPEAIARAARLYATTRPGCIIWGNGLDHLGRNAFQANRAVLCLMGLTGNIDVPGGNVFYPMPALAFPDLRAKLGPAQEAKRLGGSRFRALDRAGFAHPPTLFRTILSGEPYPVKALVAVGSNLVTTYPNTARVVEALQALDLLVVHDIFMTPTAELADVVLPAAANLERDDPRLILHIKGPGAMWVDTVSAKAVQVGERRSDWEFMIGLGCALGFEEYFPSLEQLADDAIAPMGITWAELKARQPVRLPIEYRKYEREGFGTPTGKFEFASTQMRDWGYDSLPRHEEQAQSSDYPLLLITGAKQPHYYHSQGRQMEILRHLEREPLVEMHSETAAAHGLAAGDHAWVETPRGRMRLKVRTHERIHPKVVAVPHGWWLPEAPGPEHAVREVCANVLTDDDPETCDPVFGGSQLKGLLCRISKI